MEQLENTLNKLVSIPSVFPHEQDLADYLFENLKPISDELLRLPVSPGRDCIVARIGQSDSYPLFYGHMDTVPPDPLWKGDPFRVTVSNGIARGLGVSDMKGGIAAILMSAQYAYEHGLPMKIAFGVDEENISLGSHILSKHDFFDDVSLIVSAENGQVFDENQSFTLNYGRKGRFVMKMFVKGKTAHAARSDQSVNAIIDAGRVLSCIKALEFPAHSQLGRLDIIPFDIESHTDSFSIPSVATILFNVLTVPGVLQSDILKAVRKVLKTHHIDAEVGIVDRETPYMEAYEVDRTDPIIQKLERDIFTLHNVKAGYAISVADENRFAHELGIPVISLGPVGGGDHTAHEWVDMKSLEKTYDVYCEIVKRLL